MRFKAIVGLCCVLLLITSAAGLVACGDGGQDTIAVNDPEPEATTESPPVGSPTQGFSAAEVFRRAADGVVTVRSVFGQGGPGGGGAEGSGFVLSKRGEIITNSHVVASDVADESARADEVYVEFADREVIEAEIVGTDPFYDVALLQVDPSEVDLEPLTLGNDENLVTGQPVAAIGSPFGARQSLTVGVISATDRSIRSLTRFQIEGAIQTDAAINPGNSGGPLLDANARVIGINQQIDTRTGRNAGVGYAVPASAIVRSVEQFRENGEVSYPYVGVSSQNIYPQLAERLNMEIEYGALVADVVPGSPADRAGLRGGTSTLRFQAGTYNVGGDVILALDGNRIVRTDDLATFLGDRQPGDTVALQILREGESREIKLTLGERPLGSSG